jgi:hypothetical protein
MSDYRQAWLATARDAVEITGELRQFGFLGPIGDAFIADVTEQLLADDGTAAPDVYRLRWLRALIALTGVAEWCIAQRSNRPLAMRPTWPLKQTIENELGEWSPYRAAEAYAREMRERYETKRQGAQSGATSSPSNDATKPAGAERDERRRRDTSARGRRTTRKKNAARAANARAGGHVELRHADKKRPARCAHTRRSDTQRSLFYG